MGIFWASFSIGLGSLGAFIPTVTVPILGEYGTMWMANAFVVCGTLVCLVFVPTSKKE